jgi:hypothetical protein
MQEELLQSKMIMMRDLEDVDYDHNRESQMKKYTLKKTKINNIL